MSTPIQSSYNPREEVFDNLYDNLNLQLANDVFVRSEDDLDDTSDFFDASSIDSASDSASDTASYTTASSTSSDPFDQAEASQLPTYIKVSLVYSQVSYLTSLTVEHITLFHFT